MEKIHEIQQNLYIKEVERLLKRRADNVEQHAIKTAFKRQWSSLDTAKLISGASDRIDRQNDFA